MDESTPPENPQGEPATPQPGLTPQGQQQPGFPQQPDFTPQPSFMPQAGFPQPGVAQQPGFPVQQPQGGFLGGYPGMMNEAQSVSAPLRRPVTVVASFWLWVLAVLAWPLGALARDLAEQGDQFGDSGVRVGVLLQVFLLSCVALGFLWAAFLLLSGNWGGRLALCGGAVLGLIVTVENLVDGVDLSPTAITVLVLRLVLPLAAATLSFLPPVKPYFAANTP
ncbi:hypothetical protein F0L68_07125 [Solihabitans fulvus]|uniref:Uncharacterized protein n=1 Tax=Solihabitans fulvus TaxID=1892852 RepID=A0A5B2XPM1_9PSEU|nr:hypothetical protein [Solihabitans fulvus]KAA2264841.1 hypothetical protein F0L68_07125 [Solihabitans fulvus]